MRSRDSFEVPDHRFALAWSSRVDRVLPCPSPALRAYASPSRCTRLMALGTSSRQARSHSDFTKMPSPHPLPVIHPSFSRSEPCPLQQHTTPLPNDEPPRRFFLAPRRDDTTKVSCGRPEHAVSGTMEGKVPGFWEEQDLCSNGPPRNEMRKPTAIRQRFIPL